MHDRTDPVALIRARLADGRQIADADIAALVAECDRLRAALTKWCAMGEAIQQPPPTNDPLIELALSMSVAEMVCIDTGQDGIARLLAQTRTALRQLRVERDGLRAALANAPPPAPVARE